MNCPKCGTPLSEGSAFCNQCGAKLEAPRRFCTGCGAPLDPGAAFCVRCGARQIPAEAPAPSADPAPEAAPAQAPAPSADPAPEAAPAEAPAPSADPAPEAAPAQAPAPSADPAPEAAPAQAPVPPADPAKNRTHPKKSKKKKAIILSVVAILLVAVGIGAWFGITAILNKNAYSHAEALIEEGKIQDAIHVLQDLGGYRDAEERAAQLEENEKLYTELQEHLENGLYDEAQDILDTLGDYRDCKALSQELEDHLDQYAKACSLLENQEFDAAAEIFQALGDFSDADHMANQRVPYEKTCAALELMGTGQLEDAYILLGLTDTYADSVEGSIAILEHAFRQYDALGTYEDSPEYRDSVALSLMFIYAGSDDFDSAEIYAQVLGGDAVEQLEIMRESRDADLSLAEVLLEICSTETCDRSGNFLKDANAELAPMAGRQFSYAVQGIYDEYLDLLNDAEGCLDAYGIISDMQKWYDLALARTDLVHCIAEETGLIHTQAELSDELEKTRTLLLAKQELCVMVSDQMAQSQVLHDSSGDYIMIDNTSDLEALMVLRVHFLDADGNDLGQSELYSVKVPMGETVRVPIVNEAGYTYAVANIDLHFDVISRNGVYLG